MLSTADLRWFGLLCLLVLLHPGASAAESRQTFCCKDDKGQQICSDQLPQQCYGRAYWVIEGGSVTKQVEAPLSPEQRREREAQEKRKKEQERAAREEARRNKLLLDTYPTLQDIDILRERAVREIEQGMVQAQEELAELMKKRKALADDAEFYKRKAMPYELQSAIRSNDADIAAQQGTIDAKKKDIKAVNARFDEDKRRYLELTRNQPRPVAD